MIMKKLFSTVLVAAAVVAAALFVLQREEKRLRLLYAKVEKRLSMKKNPMTVEF